MSAKHPTSPAEPVSAAPSYEQWLFSDDPLIEAWVDAARAHAEAIDAIRSELDTELPAGEADWLRGDADIADEPGAF